jgi:hypothetical protein
VLQVQDAAIEQDFNHILVLEDIIADLGLWKSIEEKHPNIQNDAIWLQLPQ